MQLGYQCLSVRSNFHPSFSGTQLQLCRAKTFSSIPSRSSFFRKFIHTSRQPARSSVKTMASSTRTSGSISEVVTSALKKEDSIPRLMVVSDLDNTMVDHQDQESQSLRDFSALWDKEFLGNSLLVYSTGRSPTLYLQLKGEKPLRTPDIVICSVGTEICIGPEMTPDKGWEDLLDQGWDREVVVQEAAKHPKLRPQSTTEQRPHKISFSVEKDSAGSIVESLTASLKEKGLKAKIIYSGGFDLDILPEGAGKGRALEYLLRKLREIGKHPTHTLACGDSGNDAELFTVREDGVRGVIVGNAMDELKQWHSQQSTADSDHVFLARKRCAAGIMEAIDHFRL